MSATHGFIIEEGKGGFILRDTDPRNRWNITWVFKTADYADQFAWKCHEFKTGRLQSLAPCYGHILI